jgi:hypothetical protein
MSILDLGLAIPDRGPGQALDFRFGIRLTPYYSLLANNSIRSRQHIRRNNKTDLLGGFEIDDEFELRRLLDRQISRVRAF